MNRQQKVCLWAGIAVFVLMGLFPPWYHTHNTWTEYHYSFLLSPPMPHERDRRDARYVRSQQRFQLDTHRLYVQWAMVVVVTGGLLLTFHKKQQAPGPMER